MIYSLRNKKSASGFTLIELLVVIAIIGVLATVVLASLNTARRKSRDARRVTDLKQLQLALELYYDGQAALDQYPPGAACDLTAAPPTYYGLEALQTGGYIASIPRDPSTGACYLYRVATIGAVNRTYHLAAILEDSTNNAFNSDRDCTSVTNGTATSCLPSTPSAAWEGHAGINGVGTVACTGVSGTLDQCYDVTP